MLNYFKRFFIFLNNLIYPKISLGLYTYGRPKVVRYSGNQKVTIGKFCSIAPHVTFILAAGHRSDWVTTYPFPAFSNFWTKSSEIEEHFIEGKDVVVGNDVWIGYGATILSGVTIGDGAIIGSMCVVAKDVPPYSIVVGNPAREVRKRFEEKTITKLEKMEWWNWSKSKVDRNIKYLCNGDVDKFLKLNK